MENRKTVEAKFPVRPSKITVLGRDVPVYYCQTKTMIKKQFQDINEGLSVDFIQVPLICAYTRKRMVTPCRTQLCEHIQCFDGSALYQCSRKEDALVCPICGKKTAKIYVDGYMRSVLQQTSSGKHIQIFSDCTWAVSKDADDDNTEKEDPDDVIDLTNDTIIDLTELDVTIEEIDKTLDASK